MKSLIPGALAAGVAALLVWAIYPRDNYQFTPFESNLLIGGYVLNTRTGELYLTMAGGEISVSNLIFRPESEREPVFSFPSQASKFGGLPVSDFAPDETTGTNP